MGTDPQACGRCGHHLGSGLFCTECGRPAADDWRTGTAERPAVVVPPLTPVEAPVPPVQAVQPVQPVQPEQPPVVDPPPTARFPLFADEAVAAGSATDPATGVTPATPAAEPDVEPDVLLPLAPAPPAPRAVRTARRERRVDALPWLVGAAGLVLVAMLGALLLVGGDEEQLTTRVDESSARTPAEPETSAPAAPAAPPTSEPPAQEPSPPAEPAALTRTLGVEVPATAEPNQDVDGNLVRYEATNMIDEVPGTCWRMPGSAAGTDVVLTLPEPAEVTEVGLVNGYAKTSGDLDWYTGNRRVLEVEWVFDDGSTVRQSLGETRDLQTVPVDAVTTSTVTLRILGVSEPGRGRSARDYTAISDVAVVGSAASPRS